MLQLENIDRDDLLMDIVIWFNLYVEGKLAIDKIPSKYGGLIGEFQNFLDSDDKYLHVYDNHHTEGYFVEKTGSWVTVENNPDFESMTQFVMVSSRSKSFKTRWLTGNFTYEDKRMLDNFLRLQSQAAKEDNEYENRDVIQMLEDLDKPDEQVENTEDAETTEDNINIMDFVENEEDEEAESEGDDQNNQNDKNEEFEESDSEDYQRDCECH